MKHLALASALLGGVLVLPGPSLGHGGTYRGPGDTTPPGGGGGGGAPPPSPGPSGPGAPGAGSPGSPGSPGPQAPGSPGGVPGGTGGSARSSGGAELGPDLTSWEFWWGFNKDPYLELRAKIHAGDVLSGSDDFFLGKNDRTGISDRWRPSEQEVRDTVVPALLHVLASERDDDLLTGAMLAIAKIGDVATEDGRSPIARALEPFLAAASQEVAETAAIALGVLADERTLPLLYALAHDEPTGRKAVGAEEVPTRTRTFATYGLGLVGHRTASNAVRQEVAERLVALLEAPEFATRDIKVAAMSALGLVPIDWIPSGPTGNERPYETKAASRGALLLYLADYADPGQERRHSRTRHWFVRTHAPIAMARLIQAGPAPTSAKDLGVVAKVLDLLLEIGGEHSKERTATVQSAAIGLGMLAHAGAAQGPDDVLGRASEAALARLIELSASTADNQTECFALIALAQAGARRGPGERGEANVDLVERTLLARLGKARGQKQPWASLALGVYARAQLDEGRAPSEAVRTALRNAFQRDRTPETVGAHALALGLLRDQESRATILARFADGLRGSDTARGYLAVALGLLGAREAIEPIHQVVVASKYRPELLREAAIALGLLGDKSVGDELIRMLATAKGMSSQAAIAKALGTIGDSRSIEPLVAFLCDDAHTTSARAFAAVALGSVCAREDLPWNSKLSVNCNYRASTTTLTGAGLGILDLL